MQNAVVTALVCISFFSCKNSNNNESGKGLSGGNDSAIEQVRYEYGIAVDSFYVAEGEVGRGQTLSGIFAAVGVPAQVTRQLLAVPSANFNPRSIHPGKQYLVFYPLTYQNEGEYDSIPRYFVYKQSLTETVVFHLTDSLHIEKQVKDVETRQRCSSAVIESSLWNALVGQNLSPQLAVELSEIYAWTIDFFALQKGDSVRAFYDELYVDSVRIGVGRVYAASFYHGGVLQNAYFFDSQTLNDSVKHSYAVGYYDADGKNLKKAFLKAPLNYKRISSTFTYARRHPIYKTVRPHTGVDYAAPAGTPVVALGDGTVIEKGYKGGGGNTVKIRHNSVYTTAYLHLSKYGKGVAVGKRVSQGQVIGYVGSTGASTGPHLDFRVWKNGTPVNPLTLESPSAEPVPADCRGQFDSLVVRMNVRLKEE